MATLEFVQKRQCLFDVFKGEDVAVDVSLTSCNGGVAFRLEMIKREAFNSCLLRGEAPTSLRDAVVASAGFEGAVDEDVLDEVSQEVIVPCNIELIVLAVHSVDQAPSI